MQIQIKTWLSTKAALLCGSTQAGEILVTPTAEQIMALSEADRVALAKHTVGAVPARSINVDRPGWDGLLAGLVAARAETERMAAERDANIENERTAYRVALALLEAREYYDDSLPPTTRDDVRFCYAPNYASHDDEARRLWEQVERVLHAEKRRLISEADAALGSDPQSHVVGSGKDAAIDEATALVLRCTQYAPTPRATAIAELAKRTRADASEAAERTNREAHRALLEQHGSPDQSERYDAGVLPEEEFDRVAKSVLFAPLGECATYQSLADADVTHTDDCCEDRVKFASDEYTGPLDADEFSRLKEIHAKAPEGATVEIREHTGSCRSCEAEIRRLGVRVSIVWAGDEYRREFAIG
jgi:hypothetical protein